jgi:hypothetical protein
MPRTGSVALRPSRPESQPVPSSEANDDRTLESSEASDNRKLESAAAMATVFF